MRVNAAIGGWSEDGEILNAFDAEELHNWLNAVALRRRHDRRIEFSEPDISFRMMEESEDAVVLRIYFELRGRPPWAPADSAEMDDIWIELRLRRQDFATAAASLQSEFASIQGL